jgi:ABC-type molybdate transport system substrate-binding protein
MPGLPRMSYWASFIVVAMTGVNVTQAIEVNVMAASAVKEAYLELVSDFEKSSGNKVITIWGGTEGLAKRISGGEVVDIVIVAAPNIDKLIMEGKLVAGSRADIAKSGVGIALRRQMTTSRTVGYSSAIPFPRQSALGKCGWLLRVELRPSTIEPLAFRLHGR